MVEQQLVRALIVSAILSLYRGIPGPGFMTTRLVILSLVVCVLNFFRNVSRASDIIDKCDRLSAPVINLTESRISEVSLCWIISHYNSSEYADGGQPSILVKRSVHLSVKRFRKYLYLIERANRLILKKTQNN